MKRFEELHVEDRNMLLFTLFSMICAASCRSVDELAEQQGSTNLEVWQQICAEAGFDECHPWADYPAPPINLPPSPGSDRPMSEKWRKVSEIFEKLVRPRPN
jgi:hypothetical protein